MTDHAEEQQMEAEALEAIFETHFNILPSSSSSGISGGCPKWTVAIYPETASDESELEELNHVACRLRVTLPTDYPESSVPELQVEIIKGLAEEHQTVLLQMAQEEAEANLGVPSIFAVAERLREWLAENNVIGLDDVSMHAQMMRKKKEEERAQKAKQAAFESQKKQEEMTEAEMEELAVRKRRSEGTPCTLENFLKWKATFEQEQAAAAAAEKENAAASNKKKDGNKNKEADDKSGRMTGYEYFSNKATNLEALEAAAEQAENNEMEDEAEDIDVNEELFEDDVDLDDLDFDDDDEDEEEEEELDI